jgi:octaprenyl-diphosphate synthase
MAEGLTHIRKHIQAELLAFDKVFKSAMKSNVPLLDKVTGYIVKTKGKQMRPMFVILAARINGMVGESTYRAATLIELLHTATLVHDDVVDDSNERRGFFSINALWKNKIAVLVGDFLLSRGMLLALNNNDFDLLKIVADAVKEMSEGELLQIEKARKLDIEESVYFDIIRKKTASLIASCCAVGAASAGASPEKIQLMYEFGQNVGIAFQIKDDIFDYQKVGTAGKPTGIDIKERKMTLPLIYLLNSSRWNERRKIIHTVKNHNQDPEKVAWVMEKVRQSGGLDYAAEKMELYRKKALELLDGYSDDVSLQSLRQLVEYTISRQK